MISQQSTEAIQALLDGIKEVPVKQRTTLIEFLLVIYASLGDEQRIIELMQTIDGIQSQQLALARTLLHQLQNHWEDAAKFAEQIRNDGNQYRTLATAEAFSWLCIERPDRALDAISSIQVKERHYSLWLKAFIHLRSGNIEEAKQALVVYNEQATSLQGVNEETLLALWDKPASNLAQFDLAYYFPILPPKLTGLQNPVARVAYYPPVLHAYINSKDSSTNYITQNQEDRIQSLRRGPNLDGNRQWGIAPTNKNRVWQNWKSFCFIMLQSCVSTLGNIISRYFFVPKVNKIRILFVSANPKDTVRLRFDEEFRSIQQTLRQPAFGHKFQLDSQWATRIDDLQELLLQYKPNIVHFSGHGSQSSEIILEDENGNSQSVSSDALSNLFCILKDDIKCVVLNACYSNEQAESIVKHIDCVIGMSNAIEDQAGIKFATSFYQALGYGKDVKTAFDLGKNRIGLAGLPDYDKPQLVMKEFEKIMFIHK